MKLRPLILLLVCLLALLCLLFTGCTQGDVARVEAQLTVLQQRGDQLSALIVQTQAALAAAKQAGLTLETARLEGVLTAAQAALPQVQEAITVTRDELAKVKADADGSVPWYAVLLPVVAQVAPRLLTLIPGLGILAEPLAALVANLHWSATATRKQKEDDKAVTP
jgi:hypothetical protein